MHLTIQDFLCLSHQRPGIRQNHAAAILPDLSGNAPDHMFGPDPVPQTYPADDTEAPIRRLQQEAQGPGLSLIQHHRRPNLEMLQHMGIGPMPQGRCRQRHFHIGCCRKYGGTIHHMPGQPGQCCRIQLVFPGSLGIMQRIPQQRVYTPAVHQVIAFAGQRIPVALPLPGIIGECNITPRLREMH